MNISRGFFYSQIISGIFICVSGCKQRPSSTSLNQESEAKLEPVYCLSKKPEFDFSKRKRRNEPQQLSNIKVVQEPGKSPYAKSKSSTNALTDTIKLLSNSSNYWRQFQRANAESETSQKCLLGTTGCWEEHELLARYVLQELKDDENFKMFKSHWNEAIKQEVLKNDGELAQVPENLWFRLLIPEGRKQVLYLARRVQDFGEYEKAFYLFRSLAVVASIMRSDEIQDFPIEKVAAGLALSSVKGRVPSTFAIETIESMNLNNISQKTTDKSEQHKFNWTQVKDILENFRNLKLAHYVQHPYTEDSLSPINVLEISEQFAMYAGLSLASFNHPTHGLVYPSYGEPGSEPQWLDFYKLAELREKYENEKIHEEKNKDVGPVFFDCIAYYPIKDLLFCNIKDYRTTTDVSKAAVYSPDGPNLKLKSELFNFNIQSVLPHVDKEKLMLQGINGYKEFDLKTLEFSA